MPNRKRKPLPSRGKRRKPRGTAKCESTNGKEQSARKRVGSEIKNLTEEENRPQIKLKSGAIVGAREAAAIWRELGALLSVDPDEFLTLLALAQNRPADADQRHFKSLRADYFLGNDSRTIRPAVRDVLLNSYEPTREGPVIAPLRLHDKADLPVAEHALKDVDKFIHNVAFGRDDKGNSRA